MAGGDLASLEMEGRVMGGIDLEKEDGWTGTSESDDSEVDPTFDVIELTRSKLSCMSLRKSRPRICDEEIAIPQLNTKEKKCFQTIEKMIKDGELDKLKLEECKLYLRKYGLRLTGIKNVLQARIKEHLEVMDGGGEKKYPVPSFVLNCKGDACMGDVVMFEQNVYDMYSVASRSATAPPCGTRTVAGRIVKESYGAAKQQHTFTVEVLWSKGEKPLPPLHPLLIKGRNLYRLKTMRQRWDDEEERNRVLQEKHKRGGIARNSREVRIREKEKKNFTGGKRRQAPVTEKNIAIGAKNVATGAAETHSTQHQAIVYEKSTVAGDQTTWPQTFVSENPIAAGAQNIRHQAPVFVMPNAARSQNTRHHGPVTDKPTAAVGAQSILNHALISDMPIAAGAQYTRHENPASRKTSAVDQFYGSRGDGFADRMPLRNLNSSSTQGSPPHGSHIYPHHQESGFCQGQPWRNLPYRGRNQHYVPCRNFHSLSKGRPQNPSYQAAQRHPCRWHLQGRCWYGDQCRYLH